MATLKGKWKFNDVLNTYDTEFEQSVEFTASFVDENVAYEARFTCIKYKPTKSNLVTYTVGSAVPTNSYWEAGEDTVVYMRAPNFDTDEWLFEGINEVDFGTTGQTVSDEFMTWLTANAVEVVEEPEAPAATITYGGAVIAELNAGQTATLECAGMQMATDVVVAVAENIGGGGGGECDKPHIIEVDELPTENIDENAVYLCGGAYYAYAKEFVTVVQDGMDFRTLADAYGLTVSFIIATTKPTTFDGDGMAFCYVEDENAFYSYDGYEWSNMESDGTEIVVVESIADAGSTGVYAVMLNGLKKYSAPSGTLAITDYRGVYDVTDFASVNVITKDAAICGIWKFNETIDAESFPYPPGGGIMRLHDVNFTTTVDGTTESWLSMARGNDSNPTNLYYFDSTDLISGSSLMHDEDGWRNDGYRIVNFGAEPQFVYSEFKEWLEANATRVESTGGSAEFNIAYGDTEPADTSKLWVKTSEPAAVNVTSNVVSGGEEVNVVNATLPDGAEGISAAAVGTKVYLFGGSPGVMKYLSTINVFDTAADTISTLDTTLPIAMTGMAAAAVGTKVYLFGGNNNSFQSTINVFDTETNTINTLSTTLPAVRDDMVAAAVGTKIYLFGGQTTGPKVVSTIYVFDTENETIKNLSATLPKAAERMAAAVVGTKVYLFGGYNNGFLSGIYVFDAAAQTISASTATLPVASRGMAAVTVGTKVYLFGGAVSGGYSSATYVFDPETDTISTLGASLPVETELMAAATIGTSAYLFGGYKALSGIYNFSVSIPLATNTLMVEVYGTKNLFSLLPNVELGVANVYKGNADGCGEKVPAALYVDGAWVEV